MGSVTAGPAWVGLLIVIVTFAGRLEAVADEPAAVPIEAGVSQLFIDDYLIEHQVDLKRTLNQPVKGNGGQVPMIAAMPDTGLLAYGSIVYDATLHKYVMFLQEFPSRAMFRTTSADGLHWDATEHSELTPLQFDIDLGVLPPNVRGRFGIDMFSCFYDRKDDRYPYKGWLWFANAGNEWEGIWYVHSADGLTWDRPYQIVDGFATEGDPTCRVITQDGRTVYGPGDVTTFYHDEEEDRFLGIFKFFSHASIRPGFNSRCRAYAFMDRMDEPFDTGRITHVELMPAMAERKGDHLFDEYYASTAWRYESLWLGGLKIYHRQGDYPFSSADCAYLKLVVSRDGLHWKKIPFANDAGITLSFENFPGASSPFVTADDFFEAKAAVPDLRLTFDTGNCAMGEDPTVSLPRCISDVVHVHAKDYKIRQKRFPGSAQGRTGQWFSPALHGSGHVDLVGIIRILADRSYDQYVCIEYNGKKVKPEEGIRLGARYVQYLVDQTASPPTETMGAR